MARLTNSSLAALPAPVTRHDYDREKLTPGVVHIGFGQFARSHVTSYFDRLNEVDAPRWGVIGVMLRRKDGMDALAEQDGLYTLVRQTTGRDSFQVVSAVHSVLFAPDNPAKVVDTIADKNIKAVTVTVTPDGYCMDGTGRHLNLQHPDILHDLANPSQPKSAIGFVVAGLAKRRSSRIPPPSVLSCDNLPNNGDLLKRLCVEYAKAFDAGLAKYIAEQVDFPNSVVDRITPKAKADTGQWLAEQVGYVDASPIVCEPEKQWVIGGDFKGDRPPLDQVGVSFAPNIAPHENMKLRLLNGAHLTLAVLGIPCGYDKVHEAANDPDIQQFMRLFTQQVADTIFIPGENVADYGNTVMRRFQNEAIQDDLARMLKHTAGKLSARIINLPAIRNGEGYEASAFAVAAWTAFMRQHYKFGQHGVITDNMADLLRHELGNGHFATTTFLARTEIFGTSGQNKSFVNQVQDYLQLIEEHGVKGALNIAFNQPAIRRNAEALYKARPR